MQGGDAPPPVPAALLKKSARGSDEVRRNNLNLGKMILKNVSGSRVSSTKNRGQKVLEAVKKRQQIVETERPAKKKKGEPTARAVAAGILSPTRRSTTGSFAPTFASPTRRHSTQAVSPARVRFATAAHLASPVRPPRSAASPARPKRSMASPLRSSAFLTSPLRHRPSASPKRPLMFDDAMDAAPAPSSRVNGHPPLLASALDQVELAPQAKNTKANAKSPFASFQAKFNGTRQSPARASSADSSETREDTALRAPRSGPTLVDLSHSDDAATSSAGSGRTAAANGNASSAGVRSNSSATAALFPASSQASSSSEPSGNSSATPGNGSTAAPSRTPVPPLLFPTEEAKPTVQQSKPPRKLFMTQTVVAKKSICFSTEGVATSLDVTPDGEIIVVGFLDGSVRLYEMDSSVPSDRHGYLLGHIDEISSGAYSLFPLRVKITSDGRYAFIGCRQGLRMVMTINLEHYRNEKEGDDDDFQQFQKHLHTHPRLKGFADVTKYAPPTEATTGQSPKRHAYYVLTGLGLGTLNLWRFVEAAKNEDEPIWDHLKAFPAGGNTATVGAFLQSSISPGVLAIAAVSQEKNLRVWPLEYKKASPDSAGDDSATETEDFAWMGGVHTVTTHFNIPNTSEIKEIVGQYAYSISPCESYRIRLPDAAEIAASEGAHFPRQSFELEKLDGGGHGKSRRSNIMLDSVAASDDGKAIIAVSTEGIFYYSNQMPEVGVEDVVKLRIVGKNASENTQFKTPMKLYTPMITSKGETTKAEAMMAVVTNPREDSEDYTGYFNVDPTETFAARWMVPSRGENCWVCGVRNVSHWSGPPEQKVKVPSLAALEAEKKAKAKAQRRRERAQRKAEEEASRQDSPETPTSSSARSTPRSIKKVKQEPSSLTTAAPATSSSASSGKKRRVSRSNDDDDDYDDNDDGDDDEDYTPSGTPRGKSVARRVTSAASSAPSVDSLTKELEHFKKRNEEIRTEWQRRLRGEQQLRRKWKQREAEFTEQLNDALEQLWNAETRAADLQTMLRDAEKRFAFEKARAEQENSVKARYEQLCEQMNDKMALVADQKRILEQTTRSLLAEVDRNVHALKNATLLEKNECVVCKDRQAVTAIVPCGHLCFCEEDAESYRRNCTTEYPTCPICQQEIVSLLRIYT